MNKNELQSIHVIIHRALEEDLGDGDITTLSTVPVRSVLKGTFIAKESGIIAGLEVVRETLKYLDPRIKFTAHVSDGNYVSKGTVLATVLGNGRALLIAERTALNFFQRMSGIATTTRMYVDAVRSTKAIIVDTRKTAPGLRLLDKMAVRIGGGQNHRFGLYDMVLIKENHIAASGGITQAVARVRAMDKKKRPIEVEVRNLDELHEALKLHVDRILLDNMSLDKLHESVRITNRMTVLEASGNVSLDSIRAIAATGVDIISVGKLTHSVRALDISFLIESVKK
ncbi:MAG: carboxylating nicotinate-nucleotide diphosphorylase [Ignavibacteriales bacterium]|nr:carboxylating nicotinate-nucleotide diphosphorylase [Ignavibacteriales bacterium]